MHHHQLINPGHGKLWLLFGYFSIIFLICQQSWAWQYADRPRCTELQIPPTNCKYGINSRQIGVCIQYSCKGDAGSVCINDSDCMRNLTCTCGVCMGCYGGQCKMNLCPSTNAKRAPIQLPYRIPNWFLRERWENVAPMNQEDNYDN